MKRNTLMNTICKLKSASANLPERKMLHLIMKCLLTSIEPNSSVNTRVQNIVKNINFCNYKFSSEVYRSYTNIL